MSPTANIERGTPDVFRQLDLYLQAEAPEVYGLHDFIESVIGGSATNSKVRDSLRAIADTGRLSDFTAVVEKFNDLIQEVRDEDDVFMFTHLVTAARDAVRVLQSIIADPKQKTPDPITLRIVNNGFTAAGDMYRTLRKRKSA